MRLSPAEGIVQFGHPRKAPRPRQASIRAVAKEMTNKLVNEMHAKALSHMRKGERDMSVQDATQLAKLLSEDLEEVVKRATGELRGQQKKGVLKEGAPKGNQNSRKG